MNYNIYYLLKDNISVLLSLEFMVFCLLMFIFSAKVVNFFLRLAEQVSKQIVRDVIGANKMLPSFKLARVMMVSLIKTSVKFSHYRTLNYFKIISAAMNRHDSKRKMDKSKLGLSVGPVFNS